MHFVDGPCGSAKTFAAIRCAHNLTALGKKVPFVQPAIFVIRQTETDFAKLTPNVRFRTIHGENSDRVIADIIDHLKHTTRPADDLIRSLSLDRMPPPVRRNKRPFYRRPISN